MADPQLASLVPAETGGKAKGDLIDVGVMGGAFDAAW